jgi:vancomycin permeability regulator SanA
MIRRRLYLWIIGILLASMTIMFSSTWWVYVNKNAIATERADCAVVFGAAVWKGGRPSHALADRTIAGIHLLEQNNVDCLIFSGADSEPEVMAKMAKKAGISKEKIKLDIKGINSLATLRNLNPDLSYILVSNDFHLGRIRMLAWKLNLNSIIHAAPYQHGHYMKESYFVFREILGTIWYMIRIDI